MLLPHSEIIEQAGEILSISGELSGRSVASLLAHHERRLKMQGIGSERRFCRVRSILRSCSY